MPAKSRRLRHGDEASALSRLHGDCKIPAWRSGSIRNIAQSAECVRDSADDAIRMSIRPGDAPIGVQDSLRERLL